MIDHDGHFKTLLQEFFQQFLELFAPEILQGRALRRVEFLDKEILSALRDFRRREPDLIARLSFEDKTNAVYLIHIEVQSHRQLEFPFRMLTYYILIHNRFPDTPIYPVALFTHDFGQDNEKNAYVVTVPGHGEVLRFNYTLVSLARLDWREFADCGNPIGAAFMARMNYGPDERAQVKAECLRVAASLDLSETQITMIGRFVETYDSVTLL